MSGSNFDGEIKQAMGPTMKGANPAKNKGPGKPTPNPHPGGQSNNATAKPPPQPVQYKPPQPQAQGQEGLQQATDQIPGHMLQGGPSMPASSGLAQAHHQIIAALAQKDMMRGQ
jgi:hypothetical protein